MTDLLTRLRQLARAEHDDLSVADDAADEIESLREDAIRYRWLLEQAWFQQAFDRFDPDDGGYQDRFVSECARIIDHARRVEGD